MSSLIKKSGTMFPSVVSDFFDSERFFNSPWLEKEFGSTWPAVNIKETAKNFDIEFAAPGYDKKDFAVKVENDVLTINAEKKEEKQEEAKQFTRKEFSYNSFSRSFTLPQSVNSENIDAKYTDGILKLVIPKKEDVKASGKKEIKVA